jgi:hypothetical protein
MASSEPADVARFALERVCSGSDAGAAVGVYSREFLDHVNYANYRGHEGIVKSLALYQLVFRDGNLSISVAEQVTSGDRVVSRWIAEGTNRGRRVRLWGITISHLDGGEIVEDWSASDTLGLVRQLGARRLLLLGLDWLRARGRAKSV